ncbi:hypothetical protein [Halobacillus litoralis]|uniref:hypothetical protein n=1 Tax=Halobacillus litoralis TaxID=45668 RepID=UPI001CFE8B99|nr:hypothetical protein [Halobacillus litoralis]
MEKLTKNFTKTSIWMKRYARPLEEARWRALFEKGSKREVLRYLTAFQNEDGGFGHGIEPDFWLPGSSPMATWAAGQQLLEMRVASKEPVITRVISYLMNTYDPETGMWPSVIPEVNDFPHAPWWHYKEGIQSQWMFNPSAELAGFLVDWSAIGSEASELGWHSIVRAVERLMAADDMDFHEVLCYQQLLSILSRYKSRLQTESLYTFSLIESHIYDLTEACVEMEPSKWGRSYSALPLDMIDGPQHPFYEKFPDLVRENAKFYMNTLLDEGVWDITWDWGDHSESYVLAKRQWQGVVAVNRYKKMKVMGWL